MIVINPISVWERKFFHQTNDDNQYHKLYQFQSLFYQKNNKFIITRSHIFWEF